MKTRIAFALCLGVCSLSVLLPLGIYKTEHPGQRCSG